jgi:hypothetical protein
VKYQLYPDNRWIAQTATVNAKCLPHLIKMNSTNYIEAEWKDIVTLDEWLDNKTSISGILNVLKKFHYKFFDPSHDEPGSSLHGPDRHLRGITARELSSKLNQDHKVEPQSSTSVTFRQIYEPKPEYKQSELEQPKQVYESKKPKFNRKGPSIVKITRENTYTPKVPLKIKVSFIKKNREMDSGPYKQRGVALNYYCTDKVLSPESALIACGSPGYEMSPFREPISYNNWY